MKKNYQDKLLDSRIFHWIDNDRVIVLTSTEFRVQTSLMYRSYTIITFNANDKDRFKSQSLMCLFKKKILQVWSFDFQEVDPFHSISFCQNGHRNRWNNIITLYDIFIESTQLEFNVKWNRISDRSKIDLLMQLLGVAAILISMISMIRYMYYCKIYFFKLTFMSL